MMLNSRGMKAHVTLRNMIILSVIVISFSFLLFPGVLTQKAIDLDIKSATIENSAKMDYELIEFKTGPVSAEMTFRFKLDKDFKVTNNEQFTVKLKEPTNFKEQKIEYFILEQTQQFISNPIYETECVGKGMVEFHHENGSIYNYSKCYPVLIGYNNRTVEAERWIPYDALGKTFRGDNKYITVKMIVHKIPTLGLSRVDVVPSIGGFDFPWDWWETDYDYRNQLYLCALDGEVYGDVIVGLDTRGALPNGSDVRIVYNASASVFTELDRLNMSHFNNASTGIMFNLTDPIGFGLCDNSSYAYYRGFDGAGAPPENESEIFASYSYFDGLAGDTVGEGWSEETGDDWDLDGSGNVFCNSYDGKCALYRSESSTLIRTYNITLYVKVTTNPTPNGWLSVTCNGDDNGDSAGAIGEGFGMDIGPDELVLQDDQYAGPAFDQDTYLFDASSTYHGELLRYGSTWEARAWKETEPRPDSVTNLGSRSAVASGNYCKLVGEPGSTTKITEAGFRYGYPPITYDNSTVETQVVADTTLPNVDFIAPTNSNGTVTYGQTYILWNVSVNEDPALAKIEINGTNQTATCVNATTSSYCFYNETGLSGTITRCALGHATDASGNWNTTLDHVCMNVDLDAPVVVVSSPENTSYNSLPINLNVTSSSDTEICLYNLDSGANTTLSNDSSTNWFLEMNPSEGLHNLFVYCNDSIGNTGLNSSIWFTYDVTPPGIDDISWRTTGGFISTELTYLQTISFFRVNVTGDPFSALLEVSDPDSIKVIDNLTMQLEHDNTYNYTTPLQLNKAGNWTIRVYSNDSVSNWNSSSVQINVTTQAQSTIDGWYGYGDGKIPSSAEITGYAAYSYDIVEVEDNASSMDSSWESIIDAVNDSYNSNMKAGINYRLDLDIGSSTVIDQIKANISANFTDLTVAPYSSTVIYISLEIIDPDSYSTDQKNIALNDLAESITAATDNLFVVYSKNYDNTSLDSGYIQYTEMVYITASDSSEYINQEAVWLRNSTSLNRIYYSLPTAVKTTAKTVQETILTQMRSTVDNTPAGSNTLVAELDNGDIVILNNESSIQDMSIDITVLSGNDGKDAWEATSNFLIEANSDLQFSINVSATTAVMVYFEDIDHIQMDSLTNANVYKGSTSSTGNFTWGDGGMDGNWGLYGANDILTEVFDPHYTRNTFMTYYGWLNASYVNTEEFDLYDVIIIADKNNGEIDALNHSATEFYGYISVADYANNQAWTDSKIAEADGWLAINSSIHLFIDGLDSGVGGTNFSSRMKDLVDYVQIDKGRKAILNTYTAYDEFATWGDGGIMKESCVNRWNGNDASAPDNYTREDWSLEMERATWFQNHNVPVYCQAFSNRSLDDSSQVILNVSELEDIYYASKVLGYDYFYLSQPDFNYAHTEFVYDVGNDLSSSWSTDDDEIYYRTYSNGIVYYNTSSEDGWFVDGRVVNKVEVCFNLYDAHANGVTFHFNINSDGGAGESGNYTISDGWGVGTWAWKCVEINETTDGGRYLIEGWVMSRSTTAGQGLNLATATVTGEGRHSWWDTSATDNWNVYGDGINWMVNISVNETKKISIDSTNQITQTETDVINGKNVTLISSKAFGVEVWSYPTTVSALQEVRYWNGSNSFNLSYSLRTDCDSNNPTFISTVADEETHKVCVESSGADFIVRVAPPNMSTRTYMLYDDVAPPSINLSNPTNSTYITLPIDINVTIDEEGYCLYNLDNGENITLSNSSSTIWFGLTNSSLEELHTYNLNIYCNDTSGNMGLNNTIWFTYDIIPVDFIPSTPSNATIYEGKQDITINISSDSSLNECELTWRSERYAMAKDGIYCNYTVTESMQAFNQWLIFSVKVNDTSGNDNTTTTRYVFIYDTNPDSPGGGSGGGDDDDLPPNDGGEDPETTNETTTYPMYCGNGICDMNETIDGCPDECTEFSVTPPSIVKPLELVPVIQTPIVVNSFRNQTIRISPECLGDESCSWVTFVVASESEPIMDIELLEGQTNTFYTKVTVPESHTREEHRFNIRIEGENQTTIIPYHLKVEFDPEWYEWFTIEMDNFLKGIYYEFPNNNIPPITGGMLSIFGILLVIGAFSVWIIRRGKKRNPLK
jgi:hypothetical protein